MRIYDKRFLSDSISSDNDSDTKIRSATKKQYARIIV